MTHDFSAGVDALCEAFAAQLHHVLDTGGDPGLVALAWAVSGDLPDHALAEIYKDVTAQTVVSITRPRSDGKTDA